MLGLKGLTTPLTLQYYPTFQRLPYTHFIITIIYYYQLYFVKCTPWKRQNELCNHFAEGYPSSIKTTIDLASHVLHSLLGTMFTVYVVQGLPAT